MNHIVKTIHFCIFMAVAMSFLSCHSVPKSVDPEWSGEMFFKQAQEAIDNDRLETALFYYEVFLVRYPEIHERVIAAEYERAILHKKLGAKDLAIKGLKDVLDKYENSPHVILYPTRYKKLATKVLARMEGRPVEKVDPQKYPERQKPAEKPAEKPSRN